MDDDQGERDYKDFLFQLSVLSVFVPKELLEK